jgi:predicted nucleotidyltransferase
MSDVQEVKKIITPILNRHGVTKAGVFGSFAREEAGRKSDIDILVEIRKKNFSLLDFVGLKLELEDALGREVDLVEYDTIKPRLKDVILKEELAIL